MPEPVPASSTPKECFEHRGHGLFLVLPQSAVKVEMERRETAALVDDLRAAAGHLPAEQDRLFGETARKKEPVTFLAEKIEFRFQLLADPPAEAPGRLVLRVGHREPAADQCLQGLRGPFQDGLGGNGQTRRRSCLALAR